MRTDVGAAFLLASGSPRRRDLLAEAGFRFEVVVPQVAELETSSLTIRELTTANATRKALAIARARPDAVVLGADTLVALEGCVIGKPANMRDARRTIRRLSGREHQVCTGVFICADGGKRTSSFHVFTDVQFRTVDEQGITAYFATINPFDKAGAYAAQGNGAAIIREIRGSFSNVVGLPIEETQRILATFGIHPTGKRQQISSLFPLGSSKKNA